MKYTVFFILALMGWNSWGLKFICKGGQARYQHLQWEVQNYQSYDSLYKANIHRWLAYCEMEEGKPYSNPQAALENFRIASDDFGDIKSNYFLARYLRTGGWGQDTAATNLQEAIWEFEKTLDKINAVWADYPNTEWMASDELSEQIYPGVLINLIQAYTNKYLAEGYGFYDETPPTYYDDPAKAVHRNQANKNILSKLEYHIESCLADHEGQNMMIRARRFDFIDGFDQKLTEYNAFYLKVKKVYCPHYKTLLTEMKKREAIMHTIAMNCTLPGQTPTEQRPPCADIKRETEEFEKYFIEEWEPNDVI